MPSNLTRRSLLGKTAAGAAVVAAAAALPATVQAAIQQPAVPNTRHYDTAWARQQQAQDQFMKLEDELEATLNPAQLKILDQLDSAANAHLAAEQDLYVEALAAHFPGLAPAFRAIACISHGDMPYLTCCDYWKEA